MFTRLQHKWKVGGVQLLFIIFTFAAGGSVTGFVSKKIINLLALQKDWLWTIVYILLVTLIWPLAVIVMSIFFGQFRFFSNYVRRLFAKIGLGSTRDDELAEQDQLPARGMLTHDAALAVPIAVFASGAGSNAKKIIEHFRNSNLARVALIVCNKPGAGVLEIAAAEQIPTLVIDKEQFFRGDGYLGELKKRDIAFIVLAGFLWKIPDVLIRAFPRRIINIHPALLPKFGGKGMYGERVHEAVLSSNETESGITIHYVDEHYDNGDVILQVKCPVLENDTAESLAHRIHALEHANYPVIIEELIRELVK